MKFEEIRDLYLLYGFEEEYVPDSQKYIIFSKNYGFYRNLECVMLANDETTVAGAKEKQKEYSEIGYRNITVHSFKNIIEAREALFSAFFQPIEQKKRLRKEYEIFKERQEKRLQIPYEYIMCSFLGHSTESRNDLIEYIINKKKVGQPRLTILEAAAGYGKTCTVYEILNQLLLQDELQVPLFVELSKNRNARLFRYVLQDEIDKKFTMLSSSLVLSEIKAGRLPLIIDGFDELIEQNNNILDDADERSLSMLSTIADLLGEDSKAWILLTTRNSAIFSGEMFENWVLGKLGRNCQVDRLRILKPSIKEWLGEDIYKLLQEKQISLEGIANPVLLTFLKSRNEKELKEALVNQETILERYLSLLLNRDEERLEILLKPEELYEILKKLAGMFAVFDITAESNEFIQDILGNVLENQMLELLERYRDSNRIQKELLTDKEFVQRLSHSCLLDRVSYSDNLYGFINEYILGVLTGDAVREGIIELSDISALSERYLEIMSTAYEGRSEEKRKALYLMLKERLQHVTASSRLYVECILIHITGNYKDEYFQSFEFAEHTSFSKFTNCFFESCSFIGCKIKGSSFSQCKFNNCQFYNIKFEGKNDGLIFMNCTGQEVFQGDEPAVKGTPEDVDKYEKMVLEQFWKPGSSSAELRRTYTAFFKGVSPQKHSEIQDAMQSLLKKGLLKELNICYALNTGRMSEIKYILGRS